jgi:predicted Zn-dependent protease
MIRWLDLIARAVVLPLFLAGVLPACVTEPITGRSQIVPVVSESEANKMGIQAFQQILGEAKLGIDASQNALVEKVGMRIAAVTDRRMMDEGREPYSWEFKVIDEPEAVNAFALPGGKVAFYTGILPITATETGLAVVMGHEIGHVYGEHGRHRVSNNAVAQFGFGAVAMALETGDVSAEVSKYTVAALGLGYQLGVQLPFSRADESAADHIGLTLMAEAGYDPREAVAFWQRMAAASGEGQPSEFLSTHPSHETRIERLKTLLPAAVEIYEESTYP